MRLTADGSNALSYDNNGNMLTDEQGYTYVFDAWNRMVKATASHQEVLQYDALGRGVLDNNGAGNEQLYYNTAGNVVQEQFGSIYCQYVWGLNGPADLVLRDRNADSNTATGNLGLTGSGEEEREYVMHDADGNVIGLLNILGEVTERFCYSPYGKATVLTASWGSGSDGTNYWEYFYQGMRIVDNGGTGTIYRTQTRNYDANRGTWVQQDPTGTQYVNGADLYQMEMDNPVDHVDPSGLDTQYYGAAPTQVGGAVAQALTRVQEIPPSAPPPGVMSPFVSVLQSGAGGGGAYAYGGGSGPPAGSGGFSDVLKAIGRGLAMLIPGGCDDLHRLKTAANGNRD